MILFLFYDVCDVIIIIEYTDIDGTRRTQFRNIINSNRLDRVAQLADHSTSIPEVAGSIPTVAKLTFQLARCGCTLRVTSQTRLLYLLTFSLQEFSPLV